MSQISPNPFPMYLNDTLTVTVVGVENMGQNPLSVQSVTSCSVPSESTEASEPLSAATVRIGNSLLGARVPEDRIRRDYSEEY
jgi:hypothetical protein